MLATRANLMSKHLRGFVYLEASINYVLGCMLADLNLHQQIEVRRHPRMWQLLTPLHAMLMVVAEDDLHFVKSIKTNKIIDQLVEIAYAC